MMRESSGESSLQYCLKMGMQEDCEVGERRKELVTRFYHVKVKEVSAKLDPSQQSCSHLYNSYKPINAQ